MNLENLTDEELLALDCHITRSLMQMDECLSIFEGTPYMTTDVMAPHDQIGELMDEVVDECKSRGIPEEELEPYIPPKEFAEI